jgi:hypothetical protein
MTAETRSASSFPPSLCSGPRFAVIRVSQPKCRRHAPRRDALGGQRRHPPRTPPLVSSGTLPKRVMASLAPYDSCRSTARAIEMLLHGAVAFAQGRFQALPIENCHVVMLVMNELSFLKRAGHNSHGRPRVTVGRVDPSMDARNSWLSGNSSRPTRSWVIRSHRLQRSSTGGMRRTPSSA